MKDIASQRDPRQARPNGQDWQPRSGPKPCSPSRVSPGTDDARPLSFNSPTTPRCVSECGAALLVLCVPPFPSQSVCLLDSFLVPRSGSVLLGFLCVSFFPSLSLFIISQLLFWVLLKGRSYPPQGMGSRVCFLLGRC